MSDPFVTEIRPALEPTIHDPFIDDLDRRSTPVDRRSSHRHHSPLRRPEMENAS
jgi:hypothetical protein